jgi:tetratricopeptide (TPR) repeat protein
MKKYFRMTPFLLVVFLLFGVTTAIGAEEKPGNYEAVVKQGDKLARIARKEERTEEKLRGALKKYRQALELKPDGRHALNRLALGYFTLAEAYLEDWERKKAAYSTGYEYGLRSLRTNKDFDELYKKVGFAALKNLPDSIGNVEGLFWTGANLGRLAEKKGVIDSLNDLGALVSLNRRVLELDETYLGGGARRTLGSIAGEVLGKLPLTFWQVRSNGFSWDKVREHFRRSIDLAPGCLENYLSYARYYALKRGKEDRALELLNKVLEKPLGTNYPLINDIAKGKAKVLKNEILEGRR